MTRREYLRGVAVVLVAFAVGGCGSSVVPVETTPPVLLERTSVNDVKPDVGVTPVPTEESIQTFTSSPASETGTDVIRWTPDVSQELGELTAVIGGAETRIQYFEFGEIEDELADLDLLDGDGEGNSGQWTIWTSGEFDERTFSIIAAAEDGIGFLAIPMVYPDRLDGCDSFLIANSQAFTAVCQVQLGGDGHFQEIIRVIDASILIPSSEIADPVLALVATSKSTGESKVLVRDAQKRWYDQGVPVFRDFYLADGLTWESRTSSDANKSEIMNLVAFAGRNPWEFSEDSIIRGEELPKDLMVYVAGIGGGRAIAFLVDGEGEKWVVGTKEINIKTLDGGEEVDVVETLVEIPSKANLRDLVVGEGENRRTLRADTFKWSDEEAIHVWNPEERRIETISREALASAPSWVERFSCHNGNVVSTGSVDIEACGYDFATGELIAYGPDETLAARYTKLPYGEDRLGWIVIMADSTDLTNPSIFGKGIVPIRLLSTEGVLTRPKEDIWDVSYGQQDMKLQAQRAFAFNQVDDKGYIVLPRKGEHVQHSFLNEERYPSRGDDSLRLMAIQAASIVRGERFTDTLTLLEKGEDVSVEMPNGEEWDLGKGFDIVVVDEEPENEIRLEKSGVRYGYEVVDGRLNIFFYHATYKAERIMLAPLSLFGDMVDMAIENRVSSGELTKEDGDRLLMEFVLSSTPMLEIDDQYMGFHSVSGIVSEDPLLGW